MLILDGLCNRAFGIVSKGYGIWVSRATKLLISDGASNVRIKYEAYITITDCVHHILRGWVILNGVHGGLSIWRSVLAIRRVSRELLDTL